MDRDNELELVASVDNASEQPKKTWITPQVSESPIVELTLASINSGEVDAGFYS